MPAHFAAMLIGTEPDCQSKNKMARIGRADHRSLEIAIQNHMLMNPKLTNNRVSPDV
jgi:hypothetical protein